MEQKSEEDKRHLVGSNTANQHISTVEDVNQDSIPSLDLPIESLSAFETTT